MLVLDNQGSLVYIICIATEKRESHVSYSSILREEINNEQGLCNKRHRHTGSFPRRN